MPKAKEKQGAQNAKGPVLAAHPVCFKNILFEESLRRRLLLSLRWQVRCHVPSSSLNDIAASRRFPTRMAYSLPERGKYSALELRFFRLETVPPGMLEDGSSALRRDRNGENMQSPW